MGFVGVGKVRAFGAPDHIHIEIGHDLYAGPWAETH